MNLSQPTESPLHEAREGNGQRSGTSGLVLLVLKHFLMCQCQPGTLDLLRRQLRPELARALMDPDSSRNYPSEQVDEIARAVCLYLTDGHPESFCSLVYEISLFGLRHGFRHAIELGDTRRVLDSIPELWCRLEPDHPEVTVTHGPRASVLSIPPSLHGTDELRQQSIIAVLSALLFAATGRQPVVSAREDSLGGLELSVERAYC